ncbi:IS630 family transposase [Micromonospora sp. NPDC005220]|uniref:IS630 family transposase n=1 Tax=Micromonospora sp. NPDC005220 TaxID=3155589 RepID=UPI00339FA2F4
MPRTGRPKAELVLTDEERATLVRLSRRAKSSQALALRCRIVLACAEPGATNAAVAADLRVSRPTVGKWRSRFVQRRLAGLIDEDRPGRPPSIGIDQVEEVLVSTLAETPSAATHWSRRSMAEKSGLSKSTVGRIWRRFNLRPHQEDPFKLSTEPLFTDKVVDVVGLYLNPPAGAIVLSVDQTAQIQALNRSRSALPMMRGMPERHTHDYLRYGLTSLFAAFDVDDGAVVSAPPRRRGAAEFKKFLARVDASVPTELGIHLICDNHGTHKTPTVKAWLDRHPRFRVHLTPTSSSWTKQVEGWCGFLADRMILRGTRQSVPALEADISSWVAGWNEHPSPFVWAKTTDEITEFRG